MYKSLHLLVWIPRVKELVIGKSTSSGSVICESFRKGAYSDEIEYFGSNRPRPRSNRVDAIVPSHGGVAVTFCDFDRIEELGASPQHSQVNYESVYRVTAEPSQTGVTVLPVGISASPTIR